jgi:hypothetical protein
MTERVGKDPRILLDYDPPLYDVWARFAEYHNYIQDKDRAFVRLREEIEAAYKAGYTYAQIGDAIGKNRSYVYRVMNGF